ncbi:jg25726, partial [Pararge aegeria aegeria]
AGSSKDLLNYTQNDDLDWPLTYDFPLASLVELEEEEFADDMALHESPILQPPANSPAPQSFHDSLSGSTIAAPYAEMEDDYVDAVRAAGIP